VGLTNRGSTLCSGLPSSTERLLELELPELYQHFKNEEVQPGLYASEWFSTLFAYSFPLEIGIQYCPSVSSGTSVFTSLIVVRLWDVYLEEGNEYLFKIALAILKVEPSLPCTHFINESKADVLFVFCF